MRTIRHYLFMLLVLTAGASACSGGDSGNGVLDRPQQVAVDSDNGRLVVVDADVPVLTVVDTATGDVVGEQPVISETDNDSLLPSLTASPLDLVAIASPELATTTRLFILGALEDTTSGALVSNRVSVFDYDGTTIALSAFSPIAVSDGDDGTDDAALVLSSLAVDRDSDRLFVLDKTAALLHMYSTVDGTEDDDSPIVLAGIPSDMALDLDLRRLFIANVSADNQVITVVNLDDLADVTAIPLDLDLRDIGVATSAAGTALAGSVDDEARLVVYAIDTDTFLTATEIGSITASTETTDTDDDESEETLITGSLAQVELVRTADDALFFYASQSDGNLLAGSVSSDFSAVTSFALETNNPLQDGIAVLRDPDSNAATAVYVASSSGGLVIATDVGDEENFSRIH